MIWIIPPLLGFLFGMIMAGWITFVFVKKVSWPQNTWGFFTIMFFLILTFTFGVFLTYFFSTLGIEQHFV